MCFLDNNQIGIYGLIYIFAVYTIIVYAPADVPEIPKIDNNLRKSLKIKSFVSLNLIYLVSFIIIQNMNLRVLIIYTVFFTSL